MLKNVIIEMDEKFYWYINSNEQFSDSINQIQLSQEFIDEYNLISLRYAEMQEYLEHCYRHQAGLPAYYDSPFYKI